MKNTFKSDKFIGERIRKVRKEKGITMEEVGNRADIAQSYLSNIERGKVKSPGIDVVKRIAEALEVSIDTLADTDLSENNNEGTNDSATLNSQNPTINDKMLTKALEYSAVKIVVRTFADSSISVDTKKELDKIIGSTLNLVLSD